MSRYRFHCPNCGRYVSNVLAEEYGELQGLDSWYPYFKWGVFGDCKIDGRVEIQDHDGEDGCECYAVGDREVWFDDSEATDVEANTVTGEPPTNTKASQR